MIVKVIFIFETIRFGQYWFQLSNLNKNIWLNIPLKNTMINVQIKAKEQCVNKCFLDILQINA